ncbi:unnamed protein product [Spirodela intermedia]|uniref:Uncharacterized protein n=2 Tax=Spirodela intermedia TaxID=51605 RepID=A0ABN7EA04_SPIIN|nr:unnamed protein product [Spirodela intermedia]CAA6656244.1 unnamed protein product [Spirodela intermedia]CAA6673868.1 unnamed protein product [Spirodela intermedia]CAA7391768.1 unnamed protein product [Spirodela intermedia]
MIGTPLHICDKRNKSHPLSPNIFVMILSSTSAIPYK